MLKILTQDFSKQKQDGSRVTAAYAYYYQMELDNSLVLLNHRFFSALWVIAVLFFKKILHFLITPLYILTIMQFYLPHHLIFNLKTIRKI